jgi:dTMP kinase
VYIVFEGIDGCGKSTQIELLKDIYKRAVFTKEPGGTSFGVKARELLLHSDIKSKKAELLLFLSDRAEHYEEVVKPNLDNLVLSDRGFISGIAYAMSSGFELEFLLELNSFTLDNNLPQKIVLFIIDKETMISRIGNRGAMDKIESRGFEYLLDIQDKMQQVVEALGIEYLQIDAKESIETINRKIVDFIGE